MLKARTHREKLFPESISAGHGPKSAVTIGRNMYHFMKVEMAIVEDVLNCGLNLYFENMNEENKLSIFRMAELNGVLMLESV